MGLFCVSMHFRTDDDPALSAALKRRKATQSRVLPAKNGWTTLYQERASEQDADRSRDLTSGLSKDLKVAAIAFMVHDSDITCYWLYENGKLLDEYNSWPDYFAEDSDGPPEPAGGQPAVLVRFCRDGVKESDLAAILAEHVTFAEWTVEKLAQA